MKALSMKKNETKGKLITFCGLDGCGKTTMINLLYKHLENMGYEIIITKQPTNSVRKSDIFRTYMDSSNNEKYDYRSLSLFAASDRIQHGVKVIEKYLQEGKTVISDRYFFSCLANLRARGYKHDNWIYEIAEYIVEPDIAFFLDVDVETAIQRVREREEEKDKYIDYDLQQKLTNEYREIAALNNYQLIDSNNSPDVTFAKIVKITSEILQSNKDKEDINAKIERAIKKNSSIKDPVISDATKLEDLGYDSLSKTNLIIELEKIRGKEFSIDELIDINFKDVYSVKQVISNFIVNQT